MHIQVIKWNFRFMSIRPYSSTKMGANLPYFCMLFRLKTSSVGDYHPDHDMLNHAIHQLYLLMIIPYGSWHISNGSSQPTRKSSPTINCLWTVSVVLPYFFFAPGELFLQWLDKQCPQERGLLRLPPRGDSSRTKIGVYCGSMGLKLEPKGIPWNWFLAAE